MSDTSPKKDYFSLTSDIKIYYELRCSSPSSSNLSTKVVMIIGAIGTLRHFDEIVEYCIEHYPSSIEILTYDHRGLGHSKTSTMAITTERQTSSLLARDAYQLINHVWSGQTSVHVLGVSLGGIIVQELAVLLIPEQRLLSLYMGITTRESQINQATSLWNETYPKGVVIQVENVNVYTVGSDAISINDLSIIVMYDVFGFNISQTRVFCDRLSAQYKVQVAMPDFFRGKTASPHMSNLTTVLAQIGNWSQISSDLINVASWLRKTKPSRRIAVIGFCWGGLQVVRACSNLSTLFFTGLSIHGAWLTEDEIRQLQQPILFIAAGDDPPLKPNISSVIEQWTSPRVANQSQYITYSNMIHGFVSGGANYSNPENVVAIDDVHERVRNFLDQISRNSASSTHFSIHFVLLFFFYFILMEKLGDISVNFDINNP